MITLAEILELKNICENNPRELRNRNHIDKILRLIETYRDVISAAKPEAGEKKSILKRLLGRKQ